MLRVLTLNVLFGAQDKTEALGVLLSKHQPDIAILQECLSWGEEQLSLVARALELPVEQVMLAEARPRGSGNRFHITVASRLPLLQMKVHNDPSVIGHCIAECHVMYQDAPLTIFGAHFDSHNEDLRLAEARYLRALLSPSEFKTKSYLLAGDLNALSPRDPYPPDFAQKIKRAGTDKYGHPPRFDVINELENFGWIDTLRASNSERWVTAPRDRGGVFIEYRTDYIFASPGFAPRVQSVEIIDTTGLSDHHALLAIFD
jgi:exodeoxyribonuclease-3